MQIIPYLVDIYKTIAANIVTIISAPTGSGKSIGVPSIVGQTGSRIFVVVPTINAVMSLAEFQRTSTPGLHVGTAAEGDIQYDENSTVVYTTAGHMRRKMLSYFNGGQAEAMDFADVLMVDEVHGGTADNFIILSLWKQAYQQGVQVPRLVLASATLNKLTDTLFPDAALFKVESKSFPVDIRYHNKYFTLDDSKLYEETAQVALSFLQGNNAGNILIFAPGSNEVEDIMRRIHSMLDQTQQNQVLLIPAYGSLSFDDIKKIYQPVEPNQIKVIVATNIAESAITLDDLGVVIDTLVEKRSEIASSGGFRLALYPISQASGQQRAGRTGGVRSGIVYRMSTKEKFDALEASKPEEITHVPLYTFIMEIMNIGLDPHQFFSLVDPAILETNIQVLNRLGMLEGGRITKLGSFTTELPLSVKNSALIWEWIHADNYPLFPCICLVSIIDCYGPSYFYFPKKSATMADAGYTEMVEKHKNKYFDKFRGHSDLETYSNMLLDLFTFLGGFIFDKRAILKWCTANSCNNKKINELFRTIQKVIHNLKRMGYTVIEGMFTVKGTMLILGPLIEKIYSDSIFQQASGKNSYINTTNGLEYKLDTKFSVNEFGLSPSLPMPVKLVGLITAEIATQYGGVVRKINLPYDISFGSAAITTKKEEKAPKKRSSPPKTIEIVLPSKKAITPIQPSSTVVIPQEIEDIFGEEEKKETPKPEKKKSTKRDPLKGLGTGAIVGSRTAPIQRPPLSTSTEEKDKAKKALELLRSLKK